MLRVLAKLIARRIIPVASFCRSCGRDVRDFSAPDEVWERIRHLIPFRGNTLCYECFVDLTRRAGLRLSNWRLVPFPDEAGRLEEFARGGTIAET